VNPDGCRTLNHIDINQLSGNAKAAGIDPVEIYQRHTSREYQQDDNLSLQNAQSLLYESYRSQLYAFDVNKLRNRVPAPSSARADTGGSVASAQQVAPKPPPVAQPSDA